MSTVLVILLSLVGFLGLVMLWAIGSYNGLIRQKALVDEGWSGIDVQLKRRYDLVPNLVAVVDQYRIHEKEVLEKVTQMRASAASAQTLDQKAEADKGLTGALKTLFAVAENYPDLKANENFMKLQQELSSLETEIQLSRRYYNGAARNYNAAIGQFPTNVIAGFFQFKSVHYFETDQAERENPKVQFKQ